MKIHLATRTGILCHTSSFYPMTKSDYLSDVTCKRCSDALAGEVVGEAEGLLERRRLAIVAEAADFLGAGFVWSLASAQADTPTGLMVRDILAAIFVGLAEQHRAEDVAA